MTQNGTGTDRPTRAALFAALAELIDGDGPYAYSIEINTGGVEVYAGGDALAAHRWEKLFGLSPAIPDDKGREVDGRVWINWNARGVWRHWAVRVWHYIDEPECCPKCGEQTRLIASGAVGHATDEQDPCESTVDTRESAYTEPGDAERTAIVEEDAAERRAYEAELAEELAAENNPDACTELPRRVPAESTPAPGVPLAPHFNLSPIDEAEVSGS